VALEGGGRGVVRIPIDWASNANLIPPPFHSLHLQRVSGFFLFFFYCWLLKCVLTSLYSYRVSSSYFFPIFWSHSYFLLSFQENLLFFLFFNFIFGVHGVQESEIFYTRHLNSVNICYHGLFTAPQEDQNSYDYARKQFGWNGLCCYCTVLLREWREMKPWIRSLQLSTCILF